MAATTLQGYRLITDRKGMQQVLIDVAREGVQLVGLMYHFDSQQWPTPDGAFIVPSLNGHNALVSILDRNGVYKQPQSFTQRPIDSFLSFYALDGSALYATNEVNASNAPSGRSVFGGL